MTSVVSDRAPSRPWFDVLPPDAVPSRAAMRASTAASVLRAVAASLPAASLPAASLPAASLPAAGLPMAERAASLAAVADRLPPGVALAASLTAPGAAVADDAAHDRYFRIRRVAGPAPAAFLRSVLTAAALLDHEVAGGRGGETAAGLAVIAAGLAALLADATGVVLCSGVRDAPAAAAIDAMHRWRLGHQVFTVLTQGLIYALQAFEAAMRDGDGDGAATAALDLATSLLLASAAGFRFTGDFSPDAYRDVIRPTMAAPQVGEGFSGLLSVDHRYLVLVLSRLRPLMQQAARLLPAAHGRLTAALQRVYADHRFVCARFGGGEAPSLREKACRQGTGVDQLDKFARARLRLVSPPARLPRQAGRP